VNYHAGCGLQGVQKRETREIGIEKALVACRRAYLLQFLSEATSGDQGRRRAFGALRALIWFPLSGG